ncbi:MAG: DUF4271 domain-containing protein [Muribaculaceae bacterium]
MPDSLDQITSTPAPASPVAHEHGPAEAPSAASAPADTAALPPDSLALLQADSLAALAPAPAPKKAVVVVKPKPWESGIVPVDRPETAATNSGIVAIIMAMLLLTVLCMRQAGRLLSSMLDDITRNRLDRHDLDERTPAQSRLIAIFCVQTCVYEGILLLSYVRGPGAAIPVMAGCGLLIALCAGYFVFQLLAYNTVGYAFADAEHRRSWLRAFTSTQGFLGFALLPAAIVTVFYPAAGQWALLAAAVCYIIARLAFIIKGFRIFYQNFGSLLYFILYLCTLEIIPPLIVFMIAAKMVPALLL